MKVGVLALQGDVSEHIIAMQNSVKKLRISCDVLEIRTKAQLDGLSGLTIPGGESTVLQKLTEREGMFETLKAIPAIMGTCAGAIMLAKEAHHKEADQRTLELMDIGIDRNAYGRQLDSFEEEIDTEMGRMNAVFIRAPRIESIGKNVKTLASRQGEVVACEERVGNSYYMAVCFHPELTSGAFHERFLRAISVPESKL